MLHSSCAQWITVVSGRVGCGPLQNFSPSHAPIEYILYGLYDVSTSLIYPVRVPRTYHFQGYYETHHAFIAA